MKRGIFIIGLLVLLTNMMLAQEYSSSFESIFSDPDSESIRLQHIKSAVDSQGKLYIVFIGFEKQVYFGNNRSGSWKFQKLSYFDNNYKEDVRYATYPNIAVDKNDNISIIMVGQYKENLYWSTKPASQCDSKWEFKDARQFTDLKKFRILDENTDMCVDKNGGLHLLCCASVGNESVNEHWMSAVYFYKAVSSDKWEIDWVMPGIANEISYASDPSIATFGDMVYLLIGGSHDLHFALKPIGGSKWELKDFNAFSQINEMNSSKHMTSLSITPDASPVFAFYDGHNSNNNGLNWFYGMNIIRKGKCEQSEWVVDHSIPDPESKFRPAVGLDGNGKLYIAFGGRDCELYAKSCSCDKAWQRIFSGGPDTGTDFVDMVIDKNNVVHVFYASNYDNKLYYLSAVPNSTSEVCNSYPIFTSFTGKTNVGPGEKWNAKVTATDPECDKIDFYTIIKPNYVTITNNGNGTADIHATIPEGEGFGNVVFTIFLRDDKNSQDISSKNSALTVSLTLTQEGKEEGHYKIENKCKGSAASIPTSSIESIYVEDRSIPFPLKNR